MISRPLVLGLLAASSVSAAAGGAYLAVRRNTDDSAKASGPAVTQPPTPAVAETEAVITPPPARVDTPVEPVPEKPKDVTPAPGEPVRPPSSRAASRPNPSPRREDVSSTVEPARAKVSAPEASHPADVVE